MVEFKHFEEFEVKVSVNEPVFTTTVVCRLLEIPRWVLRELDKEKIISPPREKGQARLYSKRQLRKLMYVWHLMSECGVNINGIKVILEREIQD